MFGVLTSSTARGLPSRKRYAPCASWKRFSNSSSEDVLIGPTRSAQCGNHTRIEHGYGYGLLSPQDMLLGTVDVGHLTRSPPQRSRVGQRVKSRISKGREANAKVSIYRADAKLRRRCNCYSYPVRIRLRILYYQSIEKLIPSLSKAQVLLIRLP
jgi:hypothetical protein